MVIRKKFPLWGVYSTIYLLIYSSGAHKPLFLAGYYLCTPSTTLQHNLYILVFPSSVPVLLFHTMKHKLPIKMIILLLVLKVKSNDVENTQWCDI